MFEKGIKDAIHTINVVCAILGLSPEKKVLINQLCSVCLLALIQCIQSIPAVIVPIAQCAIRSYIYMPNVRVSCWITIAARRSEKFCLSKTWKLTLVLRTPMGLNCSPIPIMRVIIFTLFNPVPSRPSISLLDLEAISSFVGFLRNLIKHEHILCVEYSLVSLRKTSRLTVVVCLLVILKLDSRFSPVFVCMVDRWINTKSSCNSPSTTLPPHTLFLLPLSFRTPKSPPISTPCSIAPIQPPLRPPPPHASGPPGAPRAQLAPCSALWNNSCPPNPLPMPTRAPKTKPPTSSAANRRAPLYLARQCVHIAFTFGLVILKLDSQFSP
ncbi:hypothetical protein VP01_384g3 [Puccinia sorghi]|uniref:Uncharacterized protein n=1 Tax=Puccinia sorghi TaxID=27349 RepID=A0A0L6UT87_9BASI|nr:hypothetical protein VP01_384g3 [Puccinia sorghi]